jgi:hypothetical protein
VEIALFVVFAVGFAAGFAAGYGVRELQSRKHRRRAAPWRY